MSILFSFFKTQRTGMHWAVFAFLYLNLISCAAQQRPEEFEQIYPYRDVSRVLQKIRQTFPEAPDAYFSFLYQSGHVQGRRYLHVQQIQFYWPAMASTAPLLDRLQALMLEFRHPQPECASLQKGREVSFSGIDIPLVELTLDMACG